MIESAVTAISACPKSGHQHKQGSACTVLRKLSNEQALGGVRGVIYAAGAVGAGVGHNLSALLVNATKAFPAAAGPNGCSQTRVSVRRIARYIGHGGSTSALHLMGPAPCTPPRRRGMPIRAAEERDEASGAGARRCGIANVGGFVSAVYGRQAAPGGARREGVRARARRVLPRPRRAVAHAARARAAQARRSRPCPRYPEIPPRHPAGGPSGVSR